MLQRKKILCGIIITFSNKNYILYKSDWIMVKLKLPKTLQLATLKDAPRQKDIIARIKASENNNIVEGYRIEKNPNTDYPYKFFAEINIDNELVLTF